MPNTGKFLEAITSSIEKCLVTNPENTIIKRNIKVLDRDNVEREIDIYVETKVNQKILKYAIECKELSGKARVELKDVSDFYDKISNQGIKGIILTTTNFRRNAIKKAKNLNIDAYLITDNPDSDIDSYKLFHKRYSIDKIIFFSSNKEKFNNTKLDNIFIGDQKKCYNTLPYIASEIIPRVNQYIKSNQSSLYENLADFNDNGFKFTANKIESISIIANLNSVFFKDNNDFHSIESCQFDCRFWIDYIEENNPASYQYYDIFNKTTVANFFAKSIEIENGIKGYMSFVENKNTSEIKIDFATENPNLQVNLNTYDFGIFQPGQIKFETKKL